MRKGSGNGDPYIHPSWPALPCPEILAPERGRFRGTGSAGLGGGGGADVDAQVAVEDVFVDQLRGVAGEGDAAPAEYVGVVGDGQGLVDVLLHDEQGRPLVALGLLAAGAGVAAFARRDLQGA